MKRLFDRIIGGTRAPELAAPAEDEGYFATQFLERPEEVRPNAGWPARAQALGAQPLDPQQGAQLLLKAWGQDVLMASLGEAQRERLATALSYVTVPPGRELILQDEVGNYALIVLEGLAAVDRIQPTGARARLAEAREGDVLGEMSLLDAGARFASCVTLSRVSLAVLTCDALDELAIEEPQLGLALMASLARRLSLRMRQLSARLGALLTAG